MKPFQVIFTCSIALLLLLAGCSTDKFPRPDIKDDFCGAHINYQYCKCAFHNKFCDAVGMSKSEAKSYVNSEYNTWVEKRLNNWLAECALAGGIPGEDDCTHCDNAKGAAKEKCQEKLDDEKYGIIEKDGNLYLNSKPGEVLNIKTSDLPTWAQGKIATVGANIAVVGPPDSIVEGDEYVLLDGVPIARVGDATAHGGQITEGSETIFVNGKAVAIIGGFAVDPSVLPGPIPAVGGQITNN